MNRAAIRLGFGNHERPKKLTRRPLVSVVIPCYNYARYLPQAVASVMSQAGVELDVIIVDDASTDASPQVARQLAAGDKRISAVLHSQNLGHIASYNDGLSRVQGEYVVLLSADDLLAPGSLARSTALMEAHPGVGLVYGYAQEFHDKVPPTAEMRQSWSLWTGDEWTRIMCRRGSNIIVNPEAVLRRSVMDRLGGYRPDMPHSADMELWLRAADLGSVGRVNGNVQAFYRVHGLNMHLTDFGGGLADIQARRHVFEDMAGVPGSALDRQPGLLRMARHALAVEAVRAANQALDRGGMHASVASELATFAVETDAGVTGSAPWRAFRIRQNGRMSASRRRLAGKADYWRWSLRWRRWRRFGV
ncbi:glycosyltransferase [Arthrobacter sp. NicSoilB8]|uniref:glycosyltransferase family 2 protein n=1 Tax=Arthrobacter sp. NicSoilB8 TaxID=2830998 RepID=UPI001CC4EF6E|nr:glycosyltransferase [Arthrobacter sp. NicSoilB8]BCW73391.1 glycosyl transferase [Arthrobacter sp. NicSoilB8]